MSCYVVSDLHINSIVQFACIHDMWVGWDKKKQGYTYTPGNEQELADLLYAANVRSVNSRYGERQSTKGLVYVPQLGLLSPLHAIKLINGLMYQCDNWSGWEKSLAKRALVGIQHEALVMLPGYDDAPWSI